MSCNEKIEFISKECKLNVHPKCAKEWHGMGITVFCSCVCHLNDNEKAAALPLDGRPLGNANASTPPFRRTIGYDCT